MDSVRWNDILKAKCFLLNMDRCADRLDVALGRIRAAGFSNIERVAGYDKDVDDLAAAWYLHGNPPMNPADSFMTNKGKQACALGHYTIWKRIIDQQLPYAVVFEDDVLFHKDWEQLACTFWNSTPKDFHALFMGASFDLRSQNSIMKAPCYCTHAMIVPLEGARFMYDLCLKDPNGTWTIDMMFRKHMESIKKIPLEKQMKWYVWNGLPWPDPIAFRSTKWQDRLKNSGLVFQDETMGSFINIEP